MKVVTKDEKIAFVLSKNDKSIKKIYINNELHYCAYIDIHEENTGWYVIYKEDDIRYDEHNNIKASFKYAKVRLYVLDIYRIRSELLVPYAHFNSLEDLVYDQAKIYIEKGKLIYPPNFPKRHKNGFIVFKNEDWKLIKLNGKYGGNYVLMIAVPNQNNGQYIKYTIEPRYMYYITKSNIEREVNKFKNTNIYIYFKEGSKVKNIRDDAISYRQGLFPTTFGHVPCHIEINTDQIKKLVYCAIPEDKIRKLNLTVSEEILEATPKYYISKGRLRKNKPPHITLKKFYNEFTEDFDTYRTIVRFYRFENSTKGKFIAKKIALEDDRFIELKLTPDTTIKDCRDGFQTYYNVEFKANGLTTIGDIKISKRYIKKIIK